MRINKRKFIYLISPTKITKNFYNDLENVLKLKKVSFFQLRLKKDSFKKKLLLGKKIFKICKKYKVKFLINDDILLSQKLNADGCHLGQKDMQLVKARKLMGKKITFIDLFAGCGGLTDGFLQSGKYDPLTHIEWDPKIALT